MEDIAVIYFFIGINSIFVEKFSNNYLDFFVKIMYCYACRLI